MATESVTVEKFREGVAYIFTALDMDNNNVLDWNEVKTVIK
jgi:hypothetical protein